MNLYLTRKEAVDHEIRRPLAAGLEDLLDGGGTVDDYYDIDAVADKVIEQVVRPNGIVCYGLSPDIYPALFQDIAEQHSRPI
jgi:hypothetical protein|nr:MAG TPA: hypothetical protein [Caudoviricetes sp.]